MQLLDHQVVRARSAAAHEEWTAAASAVEDEVVQEFEMPYSKNRMLTPSGCGGLPRRSEWRECSARWQLTAATGVSDTLGTYYVLGLRVMVGRECTI